MTNPSLFNIILIWPILNVLVGIYHALFAIHLPFALGFSIILLTALIRFILSPFTASQFRATQKMQKLTPHINKLKEKHKNDSKMLQAETMKLYKEHGVNPAAGCLPILIQFPLIIAIYNVLQDVVKAKPEVLLTEINKIVYFPFLKLTSPWDPNFFGIPLGKTPETLFSMLGVAVFLIPVITALLQLIQSRMMFAPVIKDEVAAKKESDFAGAMQMQSLYILPLIIAFTSYKFPIGLSLYWNTFTIFGIIQQYQIQGGWGGVQIWIDKVKNFRK